jgi:hypothetical protein
MLVREWPVLEEDGTVTSTAGIQATDGTNELNAQALAWFIRLLIEVERALSQAG